MNSDEKKPFSYWVRYLHRNIGFFLIGLVIMYAISGVILIFRDTDLLKKEKKLVSKIAPDLKSAEIGQVLRIRDFKVTKEEGDLIYFAGGSYNKATGEAESTIKDVVFPINKFIGVHKTVSKNPLHWFQMTFGILMFFMAISSFWMFKRGSVVLKKGIYLSLAGILFALFLLLISK